MTKKIYFIFVDKIKMAFFKKKLIWSLKEQINFNLNFIEMSSQSSFMKVPYFEKLIRDEIQKNYASPNKDNTFFFSQTLTF